MRTREVRYPVQFRLGRKLLEDIDSIVDYTEESRNEWLMTAIHRYLKRGRPIAHKVTAETILYDKTVLMIRVDAETLDLINEECYGKDLPRTIWLLDACLSRLAEIKKARQRRKAA